MHQMQQEQKQRLAALSALDAAVKSSEEKGAAALLSLSTGIASPEATAAGAPTPTAVAALDPSEQLRSALREISRFRARHKGEAEADALFDQLLTDGGHSSVQKPSAVARKMEDWLMSAGGAGMAGAVLSSFMSRPAVRPLLDQLQKGEHAGAEAMREMIGNAAVFLNTLQTGGTNFTEDENAIRAVLAALIPCGDISGRIRLFARLLDSTRHRILQGNRTAAALPDCCNGWKRVHRKECSNKIDLSFATGWLHDACRIDTNSQHKKRNYIAPRTYLEHWRHVMYDSVRGYHEHMLESQEHAEYKRCGGADIKYGKMCEAVCWCMDGCDFTECADPVKTIFKVSTEVLASEIEGWLKEEAKGKEEGTELLNPFASAIVFGGYLEAIGGAVRWCLGVYTKCDSSISFYVQVVCLCKI
jgi:hypothetical protein